MLHVNDIRVTLGNNCDRQRCDNTKAENMTVKGRDSSEEQKEMSVSLFLSRIFSHNYSKLWLVHYDITSYFEGNYGLSSPKLA